MALKKKKKKGQEFPIAVTWEAEPTQKEKK